jgi:hypothetical protein
MKTQKTKQTKQTKQTKKTKQAKQTKKIKKTKKSNKSNKSLTYDKKNISLEDMSLLDYKKTKEFSSITSLSNYKSKTHIGEIYDYKPLHDKINNICIKNIIKKQPSLNKKISKDLCECIFDKNKELSIIELENRIKNKKYTPSIECITIYDKFNKKNKNKNKNSISSKSISSKSL